MEMCVSESHVDLNSSMSRYRWVRQLIKICAKFGLHSSLTTTTKLTIIRSQIAIPLSSPIYIATTAFIHC